MGNPYYDDQTGALRDGNGEIVEVFGELAEFSTTQTIRHAIDDIEAHIKQTVELLDGWTLLAYEGPTWLKDPDGYGECETDSLAEMVEFVLRTVIARLIEPRP